MKRGDGQWVFVGETNSIASALLRHFAARKSWAVDASPTHFSFELWNEKERVSRREALVQEFHPTCYHFPSRP